MNPGGRPIHIAKDEDKKKVPDIGDFLIDLCLPADQVKKKVRIGDPITFVVGFERMPNDLAIARAMDDRIGAFSRKWDRIPFEVATQEFSVERKSLIPNEIYTDVPIELRSSQFP